jgi:2-dehydro-3-deoxyphosphooctonate aldolase (KDO 8-P synthase)
MKNVYGKLQDFGAKDIILTDRGTCFGYNNLVSDMRGLVIMAETGAPVVFDATHSVQQPGGLGAASGGERRFVEVLARAAIAVGVAGVFMEVHQDPDNAPSDGPCMIKLENLENTLIRLKQYDEVTKQL